MRDAILKAADHIEAHPEAFHFMETRVPHVCGTAGCALGWIGFFAGLNAHSVGEVVAAMNTESFEFYDRMDKYGGRTWIDDPTLCAKALRGYADEFHPALS